MTLIHSNIDEMRRAYGLKGAQLASEIGCHAGTLYHWLRGASTPSTEYQFALAEYFGVSLEQLHGDTQELMIHVWTNMRWED